MALPEPRYVYLRHLYGIYRFKIPQHLDDDDEVARCQLKSEFKSESEYEIEYLCNGNQGTLPDLSTMGMFSHGHSVYLVGGTHSGPLDFNTNKHFIFNPNSILPGVHKFPTTSLPASNSTPTPYGPLIKPYIFRNKHHIYLLSHFDHSWLPEPIFSFQSFDLNKERFQTLPTPPLPLSLETQFFAAHLVVLDYIFLFTKQSMHSRFDYKNPKWRECAFSFNIRKTEWKILDSLNSEFDQQNVPIPYEHNGDTGISVEFPSNIRILIALISCKPTAYRICLDDAGGSLHPISHRPLIDHTSSLYPYKTARRPKAHLLDLGDERFCVIYTSLDTPLLVYIFKMDFAVEYYENNEKSDSDTATQSAVILCSKIFKHNIDVFRERRPLSVCLASGPSSQGRLPTHDDVEVDYSQQPDEPPEEPVQKIAGVAYVTDDETEESD